MAFDRFRDVYLPDDIPGYGWVSGPRFKTTIQVSSGGGERPNQEWEHPLHRFVLPEAVARDSAMINSLKDHWLIMAGPFYFWPCADPLDKASIAHEPNIFDSELELLIGETDQFIDFGDGFSDSFQLIKTYSRGGFTYSRIIQFPVVNTVLVAVDGVLVDPSNYTVTRQGGIITFDTPPADDAMITAGFLFDVPVRFESDDAIEQIVRTWRTGGASDITLIEVRPC